MKQNCNKNFFCFCIALTFTTCINITKAQTTLYDNGPVYNIGSAGSGGANISMLYTTTFGMGTIGFGAQQIAYNRIADDFNVTDCQWNVDSIVFFCYQTGSSTTSTITSINFRIWDSIPDDVGSSVVYGDTTTNALTSTSWSGYYRVTETTLTSTARPIMRNVCATPGLILSAGDFWVDWSLAGTLSSGPWSPPIALVNANVTGNGRQRVGSSWANALDGGTGNAAQGFPFIIYGSMVQIVGTDTRTECNSYTWIDGNTYTSNNNTATYNYVGGAANGCDSLVTLDLTINNSAIGTDVHSACNSFTWIDGNTYTASNNSATYNYVGGAVNGCDSLVTLDLTINNSAIGTDVHSGCNSFTWIDGNTYTASNNSATYNYVGGAANGCDSLVTLDLTINNVSNLTTSISGTTISANNSGATYQWLDCNNNYAIIPLETSQSFTATSNGNYAVELTENGCVDTSACIAITNVGLLENGFGKMLLVYPNPTHEKFTIDLGTIQENTQITITDILGKLIISKNIIQSQILSLSIEEPAGIYNIRIQSGNKMSIVRLIKQ